MSKLEPGEVPCEKAEDPSPQREQRTEHVPGAEDTRSQALRAHREAAQREAQGPADDGRAAACSPAMPVRETPGDLTTSLNPQEGRRAALRALRVQVACGLADMGTAAKAAGSA